jgi:hypothetical protein
MMIHPTPVDIRSADSQFAPQLAGASSPVQVGSTGLGYKAPASRANPAKVEGFGNRDLLQEIDMARILVGEAIPLRPGAR